MTLSEYLIEAVAKRKTGKYIVGELKRESTYRDFVSTIESVATDAGNDARMNYEDEVSVFKSLFPIAEESKRCVYKALDMARYIALVNSKGFMMILRFINRGTPSSIRLYKNIGKNVYVCGYWDSAGYGVFSFDDTIRILGDVLRDDVPSGRY